MTVTFRPVKSRRGSVDQQGMELSDTLIEWLLGIAEGVAAYGDHSNSPQGEQVARAAREAVDLFWREVGNYPSGAREYRDQTLILLLNTQPARTA